MATKSLKVIRRRISSVKNTQKVTKAMKLVAAAKLRRAQRAALASRAYVEALRQLVQGLAASLESPHPLMVAGKAAKSDLLVLTSDRGLCGGFNENLLREAAGWIKHRQAEGQELTAIIAGKKGRDAFARRPWCAAIPLLPSIPEGYPEELMREISRLLTKRFLEGAVGSTHIVYNKFLSAGRQVVAFEQLFPIAPPTESGVKPQALLYEPDASTLLDALLNASTARCIAQALLDSKASELAARMTAMDNATKNASEMIDLLKLQYNRARQATITSELLDIIGGAEAVNS